MFKHGLVEPSFMPPKDIRELRDLMRYRNKLVNIRTGEKNRFQNSLTVSNIQIANVLTDTFGKTAQSILTSVLENPNITLDDIRPLLRKISNLRQKKFTKQLMVIFQNINHQKCLFVLVIMMQLILVLII